MTKEPNAHPGAEQKPHHDTLLEMWVSICEASTAGLSVSLLMSGTLVSGDIMSYSDYLRSFGHDLGTKVLANMPDLGEQVHATFTERAEELEKESWGRTEPDKHGGEELKPCTYIHLRDANIFLNGGTTPIRVKYWRGRLDSVDGWMLGKAEVG